MSDEETTEEYTPRTDQQIRQLALDFDAGRVFLATDVDEIKLCFPVIVFADEETLSILEKRDIVAFYEFIDKALPRSINGKPMFFSAYTLTREEFGRLKAAHDEVVAFRKKFIGETDESSERP